jgi:hypothetical protein
MELSDAVQGQFEGTVQGGILVTFADVASAVVLWDSYELTWSNRSRRTCRFATTGNRSPARWRPKQRLFTRAGVYSVLSAWSLMLHSEFLYAQLPPT